MRSGESVMENPSEIHEDKLQGFEAGKGFPEYVKLNSQEYQKGFPTPLGMMYSRRIKADYPVQDEFLILGPEGNIAKQFIIDEEEQVNKRIKGMV